MLLLPLVTGDDSLSLRAAQGSKDSSTLPFPPAPGQEGGTLAVSTAVCMVGQQMAAPASLSGTLAPQEN